MNSRQKKCLPSDTEAMAADHRKPFRRRHCLVLGIPYPEEIEPVKGAVMILSFSPNLAISLESHEEINSFINGWRRLMLNIDPEIQEFLKPQHSRKIKNETRDTKVESSSRNLLRLCLFVDDDRNGSRHHSEIHDASWDRISIVQWNFKRRRMGKKLFIFILPGSVHVNRHYNGHNKCPFMTGIQANTAAT
ncbi:hypothetical protein NC653_010030 [Populus alba x Populus x berolinensis]|uniref:Uncharacterized protein n=1 Tax=Populus alba x Populus x berolinensis TaxID=444605 RepID=A0AAD6WAE3_9ROSI|nr:hypothetical protein NC653_010030 [Populus alba x Populus x berolinensis]